MRTMRQPTLVMTMRLGWFAWLALAACSVTEADHDLAGVKERATPADACEPNAKTTRAMMLGTPNITAKVGDRITLPMRFEAMPMPGDYQVFVHFVDESGSQSRFQADHAPSIATSQWNGAVAYDMTTDPVPNDLAPGTYSIRIGLYELVPPYDKRIPLAVGQGVIADNETRYTVGTLTIGGASGGTPPTTTPPSPGTIAGPVGQNAADYVLAFHDEFDVYDPNVWNDHIWYESSNPTKNYAVENGVLKIWPERDGSGSFFNRTIDTDGKYTQTYGYFEIEARLPRGKGTWPAFWIFNHIGDRRPEIDIMEAYPGGEGWGSDGPGGVRIPTAYGATIWIDANVRGGFEMIQTPDLSAGFHTYGVKWEPNKQTFYFDGVAKLAADVSMGDPMYIMLDLWFGSASGTPDGNTPTGKNNSYEVSYVRAWQFK